MGDRNATRISVSEMKSYYLYSEWCSWLLSFAEGESLGPVTHRPSGVTHRRRTGNGPSSWLRRPLLRGHSAWVARRRDGSCGFLVWVTEDVLVNGVQSVSPWSLEWLRERGL